jgi:hypothetical protein
LTVPNVFDDLFREKESAMTKTAKNRNLVTPMLLSDAATRKLETVLRFGATVLRDKILDERGDLPLPPLSALGTKWKFGARSVPLLDELEYDLAWPVLDDGLLGGEVRLDLDGHHLAGCAVAL